MSAARAAPGEQLDVLVLGAGAAGLAAASECAASGLAVRVIEARDRIGGRIHTVGSEAGLPIELGAEFVHGDARATRSLLERAGAELEKVPEQHWVLESSRLELETDRFETLGELMAPAVEPGRHDLSFEAYLAEQRARGADPETLELARMLVEGFDAADPARASARVIAEEWRAGGVSADQFRPVEGYARLLDALLRPARGRALEVRLGAPVEEVHWGETGIEVRARSEDGAPLVERARCAVVTLPLGVLQLSPESNGFVRFVPALEPKRQAVEALGMGHVVKVVMCFRAAFWEELDDGRYREAAFFHHPRAVFPTFWTALPRRVPLLTAWAGGPRVAKVDARGSAGAVEQALASVASLFPQAALSEDALEACRTHDWQDDPYARGAYSYVGVGGSLARAMLARPLAGTLFFAGEATDTEGEAGTVAGALQSGQRAAREVIEQLRHRSAASRG